MRLRGLGVGGLVDEAIGRYRRAWQPLMVLAMVWAAPYYVLLLARYAGPFSRALADPCVWFDPQVIKEDAWYWLLQAGDLLLSVWGSAAFVAATDDLLRGGPASVVRASANALRRAGSLSPAAVGWAVRTHCADFPDTAAAERARSDRPGGAGECARGAQSRRRDLT